MAGQNERYLARQMHYAIERRRPNFATEHIVLLARFDDAALDGIADYAASLRGPQRPGSN
jgi:cytochrome c553